MAEDRVRQGAKVFGVWSLGIFTFSFLANVNTTPELATFGLGAIVLTLLAIGLFLVPTAMASAELGSSFPRTGGIYVWTRLAFGERWAFVVIWIEWVSFVVAWPGIMGTITLQAAFVVDPDLENNNVFLIAIVVAVTWLAAFAALRGLQLAKGSAVFSVLVGIVLPTLLLVSFATAWVISGRRIEMATDAGALVPDLGLGNIAFLSGALLMFSGIEISAIHAGDVQNPARTIPRSNAIAVALCFLLFVPLTLALATVIPAKDIDIVTGVLQAARTMFDEFGLSWLVPVFAAMLVLGLAAALVQILGGPSRGLLVAARQGGNLPPVLQRENSRGMPVAIILLQATISSILALGYHLLGSVENAWFMFSLVQTNMTLLLYLLLFASVVACRRLRPDGVHPFRIPGRWLGLIVVLGVGSCVCLLGLTLSLFPTDDAEGLPLWVYEIALVGGTVGFAVLPLVFRLFRKPSWQTEPEVEAPRTPTAAEV